MLVRNLAIVGLTVVNVLHPLLHPFEGGALDAVLVHLDQAAFGLLSAPEEA